MAKVYIVNDMNHNFDKAKKYGELHFVTKGKVPIFKTDTSKNILVDGLEGFNVAEDYLLLSGPSLLCVQAALLVHDSNWPLKTLVFDAKRQDYTVRHLWKRE